MILWPTILEQASPSHRCVSSIQWWFRIPQVIHMYHVISGLTSRHHLPIVYENVSIFNLHYYYLVWQETHVKLWENKAISNMAMMTLKIFFIEWKGKEGYLFFYFLLKLEIIFYNHKLTEYLCEFVKLVIVKIVFHTLWGNTGYTLIMQEILLT